ncbi:MAG: sigma 54-interacting transcriptional regulator [Deltaproteobacteria bacterium]|nr:sigma 54-interacting transcriptional regulator [Deltaproteobacteria bacterium]
MIVLEVLQGTSPRSVYELREPVATLGRGPANTIVLTDYHLSGEHGQIVREGQSYVYRDLRSTNGSAVERGGNRLAVDATRRHEIGLEHGDLLLLGDPKKPVSLRIRILKSSITGEVPAIGAGADLGDRLIASRSIVDLPAVTHTIEHDPVSAVRVYKALQRLAARLDQQATLDAVAEAMFELLRQATHVAVLLRSENEKDRFVLALSRERASMPRPATAGPDPVKASRAVLRRVLADRAAILTANAQEEVASSESILGGQILSMIAVPLWRGDEITGIIQADNRYSAGMFDENDLEVALLLGSQAALAVDNATLVSRLRLAEERARGENVYLKRREVQRQRFDNIIGDSAAMKAVFAQLEKVVDTRATVCVEGETGTGKELIASAVHYKSNRKDKMFVAQNCAALPENLLESELFGHKRGAFTSADADKKGLFEIADGGTLFLDEMGEMPLSLQAKLLRVLQEGTIRPVGATSEKQVDVRIICATNRDLNVEVEKGRFRQDLFYRLMVFPIRLPPLRERGGDIPMLAKHFLARYADEYRVDLPGFTPEALDALANYPWPGNIRELENEIQRLVIQADPGCWLEVTDLSPRLRKVEGTVARIAPKKGTLKEMVEQVERWLLTEALRENGNNKTKTAVQLGITREGLHKKLAKFSL